MNYSIRRTLLGDAEGVAKVHVDAWHSTYTGIIPQTYLDARSYEQYTLYWRSALSHPEHREHNLVVVDQEDRIVGFACGGTNRDTTYEIDGEIYAIYLLQEFQGKGLGRRLFEASRKELSSEGFSGMLLWVLDANPSCGFYKHLGGCLVGEKVEDIGGRSFKELAFSWTMRFQD